MATRLPSYVVAEIPEPNRSNIQAMREFLEHRQPRYPLESISLDRQVSILFLLEHQSGLSKSSSIYCSRWAIGVPTSI